MANERKEKKSVLINQVEYGNKYLASLLNDDNVCLEFNIYLLYNLGNT